MENNKNKNIEWKVICYGEEKKQYLYRYKGLFTLNVDYNNNSSTVGYYVTILTNGAVYRGVAKNVEEAKIDVVRSLKQVVKQTINDMIAIDKSGIY